MTPPPRALVAQVRRQAAGPVPSEVRAFGALARARFGPGVAAVLFYGSCLHRHHAEGVVDLYALVDDYRAVYRRRLLRAANALLPPNVFWLQGARREGRVLGAKCAVLSLADFERGTSQWFQSYLWGRFAQPCRVLYARDPDVRGRIEAALARAVVMLLRETLACMPEDFDAEALWRQALACSYATELRPEGTRRPGELVRSASADYAALTAAAAAVIPRMAALGEDRYRQLLSPPDRRRGQRRWRLRRLQGRALHVARLMKSVLTFEHGVDYVAWKLQRHTREPIQITPRLRRHPLVFCWPLLWRLLRERRLH